MRQIEINWEGIIAYEEDNDYRIPEDGGVYEILVIQDDSKYSRKYVGKTDDLKRRYLEHLSDDEDNEDMKNGLKNYECGFDFALIDNEDDRLDAEQGLYDKYEYKWNNQRPEGSGSDDYEIIESE